MIPGEAVEAAAKATFVHANLGSAWEDAEPDWQEAYRASVQAGLEAAAQFMLAQAWDEGAAWTNDTGAYVHDDNPYRSHP